MKRFISCILSLTMAFGPGFPLAAFAGPDDFIGDAGIYVGTPSARPRPNVLFVIDNSNATLDVASGSRFDPTFTYPAAGYDSWTIYLGGNQGEFTKVQVANSTNLLENLTSNSCADIIRTTLVGTGTYSGSGTAEYPNLKGAACDTGPKGAIYALGNYLNYLNYVAVDDGDADDDGVLDGVDQCPGFDDALDGDGDGVPNGCDNCPAVSNSSQADADNDTFGDVCDLCPAGNDRIDGNNNGIPDCSEPPPDSDGDGVPDDLDNCPSVSNPLQIDSDSDTVGNACDQCPSKDDRLVSPPSCGAGGVVDSDGDGVDDGVDVCPGFNDLLDADSDGVPNDCDNCPLTSNASQANSDSDPFGDACDLCQGDNSLGDADNNDICGDQRPACSAPYSYVIVTRSNKRWELTQSHISTISNKPASSYWALLGSNDNRTANFGAWAEGVCYKTPADYCNNPGVCFLGAPETLPVASATLLDRAALALVTAMPQFAASVAALLALTSWFTPEAEAAAPPVGVSGVTQRQIIYDALTQVVGGARTAVNFGAITYGSNNHGGDLLYDISDLTDETKFTAFKTALPGPGPSDGAPVLSSNSVRPLSSALYDAGYYFGANYSPARIGSRIPNAIKNACGYDHIIVITNGLPNNDASNPMPATIGDADGDGVNEDVYGLGDHYLDDVAWYLRKNNGITTHTVLAFQPSDPLVERTAMNGGGEFYNAYDAQELAAALTKLLIRIVNESDTAFVAPVVPASATNRTISSDRVYLGLFKPQIKDPWLGNIKKYRVGSAETLLDSQGAAATEVGTGTFIENTLSYWGTGVNADGDDIIYCFDSDRLLAAGDGGLVGCGGVGGVLKGRDLVNDPRKIYTYPPSSGSTNLTHANNAFVTSNALITSTLLDVADNTEKDATINFIRGHDVDSIDPTAKRSWMLGDILHSKPVVFNYTDYAGAQENLCSEDVISGDPYNSSIIFVGSNDGMLHAFRDCDGSEIWGFIPPHVLKSLKEYRDGLHHNYVDSPAVAYVHDANNNGIIETGNGDKVVLIFGLRRGGASDDIDNDDPWGAYYLLDVSTPATPVLLGFVDNTVTGLEKMGQTWSQPRLTKINDNGDTKVVAIITGGYDKNEDLRYGQTQTFPDTTDDDVANGSAVVPVQLDDGALLSGAGKTSLGTSSQYKLRGNAVYVIEVAQLNLSGGAYTPSFANTGAVVWAYDDDNNNNLTYAIPSDLLLISGANNYAEQFYVGDTGGRMWRFDISSPNKANWGGEIIFDANDPNSGRGSDVGRKFFYRPAAAIIGGEVHLWFGSGDRAHPLNHAVIDRMYHLVDKGQDTSSGINEARLVDLTVDQLQAGDITTVTETLNKLHNNPTIAGTDPNYPYHGWFIKMNWDYPDAAASTIVGEKMLATPIVFNNEAYFTTYTPEVDPNANDPCVAGNLGTARLYHLSAQSGEAVFNYDLLNDSAYGTLADESRAKGKDGAVLLRSDRVKTLGHGIPSGVVTLIDASGRVTLMDNAGGSVHTTNATDLKLISPVYWMQW